MSVSACLAALAAAVADAEPATRVHLVALRVAAPLAAAVRQGLTLIHFSAQLELTSTVSAQPKLTLSPI